MHSNKTYNRMRVLQDGMTISEAYPFVKLGPYTGRVGNIPCFASVYSIKAKSLRPRYMANKPFTIQILDEFDNVMVMYGIAAAEQIAKHPKGVIAGA